MERLRGFSRFFNQTSQTDHSSVSVIYNPDARNERSNTNINPYGNVVIVQPADSERLETVSGENIESNQISIQGNTSNRETNRHHPESATAMLGDYADVNTSNRRFWAQAYFVVMLKLFYYTAIVPFDVTSTDLNKPTKKHKVVCICINVFAVVEIFRLWKSLYMSTIYYHNRLEYFVHLGYGINHGVVCMYFLMLVWINRSKFSRLSKAFQQDEDDLNTPTHEMLKRVWFGVLLSTTALCSLLYPIFDSASSYGFDFEAILLDNSYKFSKFLHMWREGYNTTVIFINYGTSITSATSCSAIVGITLKILGVAVEHLVKDFALVVGVSFYLATTNMNHLLEESSDHTRIWSSYKRLRLTIKYINASCGALLQFLHLENLLYCAYMLFYHVILGEYDYVAVLDVFSILKIIAFYIVCSKAACLNESLRNWIRANCASDATVYFNGQFNVKASDVLDELNTDPIGIGSSIFFLNSDFFWKFTSLVGSCFLFFVESLGLDTS